MNMKKIMLGLTLVLGFTAAQAQKDNDVVTKEIAVDNFTAMELNGVMNVYLTQGDKVSVKVEADEKAQEKVEIKTEGNTLYVKTKKGLGNTKKLNVYITFTTLEEINNRLVGKLSSENTIKLHSLRYKSSAVGNTNLQLDIEDLKVNLAAVGNTELSGKATNCALDNSSVGNVRASGLIVDNMDLNSSAIGNLEYYAKNTRSIKSSGIGKVTNRVKKEDSK